MPYRPVTGGLIAHIFRRIFHLGNLVALWIYYESGLLIPPAYQGIEPQILCGVLLIILILEMLRLCLGWNIYGMRNYEKSGISAFAWGAIGMTAVLLLAPKAYAIPIVCSYAIGDPLLGELRATKLPKPVTALIGVLVICGIWWLAQLNFHTPVWLIFLMGPVTVAAEWPCLTWIDDNALMQLLPLLVILALKPN